MFQAAAYPARSRLVPAAAWIALGLSILAAGIGYWTIGPNTGLLFAGILLAALLVPVMSLCEPAFQDRLFIAAGISDGIAGVWFIAVFTSEIGFIQWLLLYAVLLAWCFALLGLAALAQRVVRNPVPAAALVVLPALLWVTSPIWLGMRADRIVAVHPLMVVDGIVRQFIPWSERPIAYRSLLNLGQDIPYRRPDSVLPMIVVHSLIGVAAVVGARLPGRS